MNHQQISDRLRDLNEQIIEAAERAQERERQNQQAERARIKAACASIGHIFTHNGFSFSGSSDRYCAVCFEREPSLAPAPHGITTVYGD